MFKKTFTITIFMILISLILVSCSQVEDNSNIESDLNEAKTKIEDLTSKNKNLEKENEDLENQINDLQESNSPINLIDFSLDVMLAIKNKDMNLLSSYVHPSKGLRFTPYSYIDIQNDQVFTPSEIAGLNGDNTVYTWGNYDGKGNPIDLKFSDYYSEFVYDKDFINPHMIGNNIAIGTGNSLDNVTDVYPNGKFVEYHFTGFDPQYEGIDWESLTLVFEEDNGDWYLVNIVHEQWTI